MANMLTNRKRFTNIAELDADLENRLMNLIDKCDSQYSLGMITPEYYENTKMTLFELGKNEIMITFFETYIFPN